MHIIKPGNQQFRPENPTIILDRDGVLNVDRNNYVKYPQEISIIPQAKSAVALLNQLNYNIFLATNQQCINKKLITAKQALIINQLILDYVGCQPVEIHMCPHLVSENCLCRKPQPGMIQAILSRYHIQPTSTLFVGDKITDRMAAQQVGVPFALVQTGEWAGDPHDSSLTTFADLLELAKNLYTCAHPTNQY